MKILLIQPLVGYMDAMRSAPGLPLGLLCAASGLVSRYEVQILDARLSKDIYGDIKKALSDDLLFVGITCHTGPMITNALNLSRFVKENSLRPVVWGGIHASLVPEQTLNDPAVDICVIGEGERTVVELANALENGFDIESVKGIAFIKNNKTVVTEKRDLLPPEQWPEPAFDLVDVRDYLPVYDGRKSIYFQASRGCPHSCGYCYNAPFNRRKYRKLDPDMVIKRLSRLKEVSDFQDVYFVDDNFFVDLDWAMKIADGVNKMGISWQIQGVDVSSLLRMDDDYIKRLSRTGCKRLTIGVETAGERIRSQIHKSGSREDIINGIKKVDGSGIKVFASFMVGFPTETLEEMKQTVNLAFELLNRFSFLRVSPVYCYTPLPGTEFFEIAVKEGFPPPDSLEDWAKIGGFDDFSWKRSVNGKVYNRKFFEGLNTATLFIDGKVNDYSNSPITRFLSAIYRPLARFRAKKLFFSLMPERFLLRGYISRMTD